MVAFVFPVLLQWHSLRQCRVQYSHWFHGPGVIDTHDDEVILRDVPDHGQEQDQVITHENKQCIPLTLAPHILMQPVVIGTVFAFAVAALLTVIILTAAA